MDRYIVVHCKQFNLEVIEQDKVLFSVKASYAKNGFGEEAGSEKTPRGWHEIVAKVGEGAPLNAVFVGRKPTGQIFDETLNRAEPDRGWILTRILWLSGLELHNANSKDRYIYIHGAPDRLIGTQHTHGCICVANEDIIKLFDLVTVGTKVLIEE